MQVTPSVTPTSSLSSNDTRSTYANNVIRGTPNSRNSVDGHSDMAATMRGSLALDPGLFGRRNYSPAVAAAATYDAARRANPYSVYQRRPEHFEYRSSVASAASAASSGGEAGAVPPSAAMGEHWPKSATLRAMPLAAMGQQQQPQLGRSTSGQFHNMVHLQNPMAAAAVSSPGGGGGLYTLRRNSLHEYGGGGGGGGGGVVGASSNGGVGTGSLMRCTTNGGTGSLQKVKRVYI